MEDTGRACMEGPNNTEDGLMNLVAPKKKQPQATGVSNAK